MEQLLYPASCTDLTEIILPSYYSTWQVNLIIYFAEAMKLNCYFLFTSVTLEITFAWGACGVKLC